MNGEALTVIIPTKNEDSTLLELLDCLDRQTLNGFKIIIADDSTTNRVRQICNERQLFYINGGLPSQARNNGVSHTNTEYILFLDADINIANNFIEKILTTIKANNVDCLSFGFSPKTSNHFLKMLHWMAKFYFLIMTKLGIPHGIGGAILVKRTVHLSVSGFDESITVAEDQDYFKRIALDYKYSFLLNPNVILNTRRFIRYGIFQLSLKYFIIEMHRLFIGEIKNNKITYFENNTIANE